MGSTAVALPSAVQGPKTLQQYLETQTYTERSGTYPCQLWMDPAGTLCIGTPLTGGSASIVVPSFTFYNEPTTQNTNYSTTILASSAFGSLTTVTSPDANKIITYACPLITIQWTTPSSTPLTLQLIGYAPNNDSTTCVTINKSYTLSVSSTGLYTTQTGGGIVPVFGGSYVTSPTSVQMTLTAFGQQGIFRMTPSMTAANTTQCVLLKVTQSSGSSWPIYPYMFDLVDYNAVSSYTSAIISQFCVCPLAMWAATTFLVLLTFNFVNSTKTCSINITYMDTSYNILSYGHLVNNFVSTMVTPTIVILFDNQSQAVGRTLTLMPIPGSMVIPVGAECLVP